MHTTNSRESVFTCFLRSGLRLGIGAGPGCSLLGNWRAICEAARVSQSNQSFSSGRKLGAWDDGPPKWLNIIRLVKDLAVEAPLQHRRFRCGATRIRSRMSRVLRNAPGWPKAIPSRSPPIISPFAGIESIEDFRIDPRRVGITQPNAPPYMTILPSYACRKRRP